MHKYRRRREKIKKRSKKTPIIIFILFLLLIIILFISYNVFASDISNIDVAYDVDMYKQQKEECVYKYRYQVNEYILEQSSVEELISFYTKFTKNKKIAETILLQSLEQDVPIHLSFAIAHTESKYNILASNRNGSHSSDYGLFQLNNSYRDWPLSKFFNIQENVKEGINYISYCLYISENNTRLAIGSYNAGPKVAISNIIPESTYNYIEKVIHYEDYLTLEFNKEFFGDQNE